MVGIDEYDKSGGSGNQLGVGEEQLRLTRQGGRIIRIILKVLQGRDHSTPLELKHLTLITTQKVNNFPHLTDEEVATQTFVLGQTANKSQASHLNSVSRFLHSQN